MRGRGPAALLAGLLVPEAALAHAPMPGLEGFYSGLAQPLREPALGLAALALVLLILQDFPRRLYRGGPVYGLGVALGLLAARPLAALLPLEPALLALAGLAAGLAALTGDRGTRPALALLPLLGLGIGATCVADPGPGTAVALTTLGTLAGTHLVLVWLGGAIDWARARTQSPVLPLGLRVAASWLTAACVLLLAVLLRPI